RRVIANPLDISRYQVEFYNLAKSETGATQKGEQRTGIGNFEQLVEIGKTNKQLDANDQHIVHVVDWLWQYAFDQRASDIYMEPRRDAGEVRFRIDGVLTPGSQIPMAGMSAKTSRLKNLAPPEVNVSTIKDPIEMIEPAFNQMQVQQSIELGFAEGVRALMRQDPDIIMVGEIRDVQTAEMAVQAALTGHLVLSTLHTNDSASAITRLLELGVPAYLLNSTILGVMAQRLVRTLCKHCKEKT